MKPDRERMLREMGLGPVWKLRVPSAAVPVGQAATAQPAAAPPLAEAVPAIVPVPDSAFVAPSGAMGWEELAASVAACRQCRLCAARKQAVLGVGDRNAD